jgi:glycosyltransferase involved in cell wall biosynthesis
MRLVSIILPTFNGQKYIAQAIESCLAQTYTNFELIIINDCSQDNTLTIAEKYAAIDGRIKVITNAENQNLPKSLNIGFGHASGAYFTWTSDDNLYAPTALEKMVEELEVSGSDVVYSSYTMIDEKGVQINKYAQRKEGLLFGCVVGPCFLYKKEVHDHLGGYNSERFRAEDMDFWMRTVVRFSVRYMDNSALYFYRLHQSSLSTQIYTNQEHYAKHKSDYKAIFRQFFESGVQLSLSNEQLDDYIGIFFFDKELFVLKQERNLSQIISRYLTLLDYLKKADWNKVGFLATEVWAILDQRREMMVQSIVDNLLLENSLLKKENPRLAKNFSKNIAWYYKEYEILPGWYKKLGHVIKMLQGNKKANNLGRKEQVT